MIKEVIAHIESNADTYVERLKEFLGIPSVSTEESHKVDMRRAAEWVHRCFADFDITSEIIDTPGHPCVIADTGPVTGGGPTVLVYGHYDVQPVGEVSLWHSKAFDPTIREGAIYARGAADDKGQIFTHILAAESWMKVAGKFPTRFKFIVEGEEEIGSPSLDGIIRKQSDRLACEYVALSDTPKFSADTPAITYGTKGMVYKEIVVCGPKQNLHSGSYGGTLANPGNVLAEIIASLKDADNRVTIPGFYDDVRELTDEERDSIRSLDFDEAGYLAAMGAPSLDGEQGYTTLERRWARPTCDVCGLFGGFTGEGASTIIPATVMGKVSMRLVPDQDPEGISKAFDDAVRAAAPKGVKLEIKTHATCAPYVCPLESPGMKAATEAIEAGFGTKPLLTREGGSLPILPLFKEVLGADSLLMGFCNPDCNAHGPNEFLGVDDFHNGIKAAAHFVDRIAKLP
ncbi:MAG: dipeptidase [Phycisphaerales bacterium]|nr:MAG: dipeptidase [Phycisphaerales bacterium]